jgi:hypothetical protein
MTQQQATRTPAGNAGRYDQLFRIEAGSAAYLALSLLLIADAEVTPFCYALNTAAS